MINRAIRFHLSKDIPNTENDVFSSKSLPIASVTKMAAQRGLNSVKSHTRSGHSLFTNKEIYLDQNILALTLSVVYALNGWVYATPKKLYPTFHCLGPLVIEQAH